MLINAHTKIAAILKENKDALEAIVSISPKFEKLRNPLLRKMLAGRASISMASKIGGCTIEDFFDKLKPLGFTIDQNAPIIQNEEKKLPDFLINLQKEKLVELDVRPILESGKDPLNYIMKSFTELEVGQVLKIINTFEPAPLISLLGKKGFSAFVNTLHNDYVETYFYKNESILVNTLPTSENSENWDDTLAGFQNILELDVRKLEMPLPMITILEALNTLPDDTALYVYHKRIPIYLLPELAERKFSHTIKPISDTEVHLLIFKSNQK